VAKTMVRLVCAATTRTTIVDVGFGPREWLLWSHRFVAEGVETAHSMASPLSARNRPNSGHSSRTLDFLDSGQ
jgi:hypothetical protein